MLSSSESESRVEIPHLREPHTYKPPDTTQHLQKTPILKSPMAFVSAFYVILLHNNPNIHLIYKVLSLASYSASLIQPIPEVVTMLFYESLPTRR
jgi:hypothetical protein